MLREVIIGGLLVSTVAAFNKNVALLPPMGWNPWNQFNCANMTEKDVRDMADAMVSTGMRDAGYVYINLDDCWQNCNLRILVEDHHSLKYNDCIDPRNGRDKDGKLVADPELFPSGIKALGDYIHGKGLKFGIYSSSGPLTCSSFVGSWGHEYEDAQTFADWGVDYIKIDCCKTDKHMAEVFFPNFAKAIEKTGRPMVYSCDTDEFFPNPKQAYINGEKPWTWALQVCNMWRTGPDMKAYPFKYLLNAELNTNFWPGMGAPLADFSGPGSWADPDMLEVGVGTMTYTQWKTHFFYWCIMGSPLLAGNDLRNMSTELKRILLPKEIIAIDQDPLGVMGQRVRYDYLRGHMVYVKPLVTGATAVLLLNRGMLAIPGAIRVTWSEIGLDPNQKMKVRDLWEKTDLGVFTRSFSSPWLALDDSMIITLDPVG